MTERVDVTWHPQDVSRLDREQLNGHRGCVVWFTGLSGSGKSTIANAVDRQLWERGVHTILLDGDNVRLGLSASPALLESVHGIEFASRFGLGFGPSDREENIRRIAAVAQLFCDAGIVTLTAFVSPYRRDRELARQAITRRGRATDFLEVYVDTPLHVCETRDPKGLYRQSRAGQIKGFTGIDDPYESPDHPDLVLSGDGHPPRALAEQVVALLQSKGILP